MKTTKKQAKAKTENNANEYNNFPKEILANIEKFGSAFLHKYPNLDAVLQGGDLLDRPQYVATLGKGLVEMKVSPKCKAKAGDHVFLGAIRVNGVALAYVDSRKGDVIHVGAMSSHIEK